VNSKYVESYKLARMLKFRQFVGRRIDFNFSFNG